MSERVTPGPVCGDSPIREAVCVHTKKVYDACRSKECIQDLRVYLTRGSQELLERSSSVKPRRAELLWVDVNVQPIDFNRGFYNVDAPTFIVRNKSKCFDFYIICGDISLFNDHSCDLPLGFHVGRVKGGHICHGCGNTPGL